MSIPLERIKTLLNTSLNRIESLADDNYAAIFYPPSRPPFKFKSLKRRFFYSVKNFLLISIHIWKWLFIHNKREFMQPETYSTFWLLSLRGSRPLNPRVSLLFTAYPRLATLSIQGKIGRAPDELLLIHTSLFQPLKINLFLIYNGKLCVLEAWY